MRMRSAYLLIFGAVVFVYSPARTFRIRVNFCVFNIFLSFIAHIIFPQVCFVHNLCNLTDTVNPRRLESITFHPLPNNGTLVNDERNV
jgi:hypothetical protein